jgi:hypothetical protein
MRTQCQRKCWSVVYRRTPMMMITESITRHAVRWDRARRQTAPRARGRARRNTPGDEVLGARCPAAENVYKTYSIDIWVGAQPPRRRRARGPSVRAPSPPGRPGRCPARPRRAAALLVPPQCQRQYLRDGSCRHSSQSQRRSRCRGRGRPVPVPVLHALQVSAGTSGRRYGGSCCATRGRH